MSFAKWQDKEAFVQSPNVPISTGTQSVDVHMNIKPIPLSHGLGFLHFTLVYFTIVCLSIWCLFHWFMSVNFKVSRQMYFYLWCIFKGVCCCRHFYAICRHYLFYLHFISYTKLTEYMLKRELFNVHRLSHWHTFRDSAQLLTTAGIIILLWYKNSVII